jgi:hypothetical protein
MHKSWPQDTIREFIALGSATGQAKADLETAEDARLFRYAVYSFRKNKNVGQDLSLSLEGNSVILRKSVVPVVSIVSEGQP